MANSPQEVLVACREHDVKAVALHVTDMLGRWHRLTVPLSRLSDESFDDGFPWTWQRSGERFGEVADVLLMPQPNTAFIEPFAELPTLCLLCTMLDPVTREELPEDSRSIALRAERYARESGVADEIRFGLTVEFFISDRNASHTSRSENCHSSGPDWTPAEYQHDPAAWPAPTAAVHRLDDDFRNGIMQALLDCGVNVKSHRQGHSDRRQSVIELDDTSLVVCADHLMVVKHIVKRLAERDGRSATFMLIPQSGAPASGMPVQLSMLKHENCVFSGAGYGGLSDAALHAIGGILSHASAIVALTNSTANSYERLAAGGLPLIAYSQSDSQVALRVPSCPAGKTKVLEFRPPDAVSNPYLGFAALLMAAVDGIQNKMDPGASRDPDLYRERGAPESIQPPVPASFETALAALQEDGEFLLRGDVFSPEMLQSWIAEMRTIEVLQNPSKS